MHFLMLLIGMRLKHVTQKLNKIFRILNMKANSEMDLLFFMALSKGYAIRYIFLLKLFQYSIEFILQNLKGIKTSISFSPR